MKLSKMEIAVGLDLVRATDLLAKFYSASNQKEYLKMLALRDLIIKILVSGKRPKAPRGKNKNA